MVATALFAGTHGSRNRVPTAGAPLDVFGGNWANNGRAFGYATEYLRLHGYPADAIGKIVGFLGDEDDDPTFRSVSDGLVTDLITLPGHVRIEEVPQGRGKLRTLTETSYVAADEHVSQFRQRLAHAAMVVLTGSTAPGIKDPIAFYIETILQLQDRGVCVFIDPRAEVLRGVLAAGVAPDGIAPNEDELSDALGGRHIDPLDHQGLVGIAKELLPGGLPIFTLGPHGTFACRGKEAWIVQCDLPDDVPFLTTNGCGDTIIGSIVAALMNGLDLRSAITLAVAMATANMATVIPGHVRVHLVHRLMSLIKVTRIPVP